MLIAKKCQSIAAKYGKDAVAVAISDRYTNEEAYAMKKMANVMGAKTLCFNNRASGLAPVLGFDASPNTIDELLSTDVILAAGFDTVSNPVMQLKLRQAAANGAKVIPVSYTHLETTEDGLFTLNNVACLGCCSLAPVMMIKSAEGDETYGNLTKDSVKDVLAEIRKRA